MADSRESVIRQRAYELFLERRESRPGDPVSDWLEAERELREIEERRYRHLGPARIQDPRHVGCLSDADGHDIENPT
jgi:DUF2934 family protein